MTNKLLTRIVFSILLITSSLTSLSAQADSVKLDSIGIVKYSPENAALHSPQKAAMYSAVLPGLGQIYNKSYWKLPLVYGGLGFLGYYLKYYNDYYYRFRNAYIYRTDKNPLTVDEFETGTIRYSEQYLAQYRDYFRRKRDLTVLGLAGVYVAAILDATVEGYLFTYDVSEDLSFKIRPTIEYTNIVSTGIKLNLRF